MYTTDEELVKVYLDGDKENFDEIVNRYLKMIYNFIYRFVGNEKLAEDITQETFIKVWKNLKKFDTTKSFKTWVYSIAKNTAIDYLRKRKDIPISMFDNESGKNIIEDTLTDEELKADEIYIMAENKKQVESVLTKLSAIQKEVVILKYVNELSLSEVSEALNIPRETIKSHHRRALIKMKKLLEEKHAPKNWFGNRSRRKIES